MSWFGKFLCCNLITAMFWFCKSQTSLPSTIDVDEYLQMESNMIIKAQNHFSKERERLKILQIHLKEWEEWRKSYSSRENEYLAVPQNRFHLFKKLTIDLDQIEKIMTQNNYNDTMMPDEIKPPTEAHLKHVAMSLVRMQYLYDIKPKEIVFGTMMGLQLNVTLDLDLCYLVGKTCLEFNEHLCATDWLNIYSSITPLEDERRKGVPGLLYPSYIFLNDTDQAITYAKNHLSENPYDIPARDTVLHLGYLMGKLDPVNLACIKTNEICRGNYNSTSPPPPPLNLKCRYIHENSPFLKIAPLKEEELYDDPKIFLYRDAIYDSEIEKMKAWAAKNLKVAMVVGKDGQANQKAFNFRICETGFLSNRSSEFPQLSKRIEDISGMSITTGEMWQLLSYSPGGHYKMHSDYLPDNAPGVQMYGNRIASMLFYLNEVTLGGETVFSNLRLSVSPIKGAAIIWYNVHADLTKNSRTDHCACPVVIGEKWGFTQWFRSKNQISVRRIFEKNLHTSSTSKKSKKSAQV